MTPPDWTDALCAQTGGDAWFPESGDHGTTAKRLCRTCPLLDDCLDYALADPSLQGIWGATSEYQRRQIRRQERAA